MQYGVTFSTCIPTTRNKRFSKRQASYVIDPQNACNGSKGSGPSSISIDLVINKSPICNEFVGNNVDKSTETTWSNSQYTSIVVQTSLSSQQSTIQSRLCANESLQCAITSCQCTNSSRQCANASCLCTIASRQCANASCLCTNANKQCANASLLCTIDNSRLEVNRDLGVTNTATNPPIPAPTPTCTQEKVGECQQISSIDDPPSLKVWRTRCMVKPDNKQVSCSLSPMHQIRFGDLILRKNEFGMYSVLYDLDNLFNSKI